MKKFRENLTDLALCLVIGAFIGAGFKAVDWIIPSPPKTVTFKVTRS